MSSADAKSALFRRVPSLTKIQARNFVLLNFSRWLCLIHEKFDMYLRHVKRSDICKCQCFCLFNIQKWSVFLKTIFSVTEISLTRDSGTRDVLRPKFENILQNTLLLHCFRSYPITVATFSVLVHQMCVLNTNKFVFAYSFSFGETS